MKKTLLGAIAIVLTVIFSSCNSRSEQKIKAETDSLNKEIMQEITKTPTPTLVDKVIEQGKAEADKYKCFFVDDRAAFEAVLLPATFIESFPNEKEYTKKETTDSIRVLVSLMERLAPYKNDTSYHFADYPTGKEIHYMSLDIVMSTTKITVWRAVASRKLCYMAFEGIGDLLSVSDEDCDGLLQPKGGGDTYRWPGAPYVSTWDFCKLPVSQHQFANQKEMEIVRYLTRYLRYHFKEA